MFQIFSVDIKTIKAPLLRRDLGYHAAKAGRGPPRKV
jgi:hypothetical protein